MVIVTALLKDVPNLDGLDRGNVLVVIDNHVYYADIASFIEEE